MTPRSNRSELLDMLTYARPAGSDTERAFIVKFIETLPNAILDPYGNWHVVIGESPILWSCHTDTVHHKPGRQSIHIDKDGIVSLSRKSRQRMNCLGADDTAGVWLLRQMILTHVPGHYLFHRAEEQGGLGSNDLAMHGANLIADSQCAIALDRRSTTDIITHQYGERCCSDAFMASLTNALGLHHEADHGTFTDTANYTDIIGECTNVSVGYFNEHTRDECLDTIYLERLFQALCRLDQSALVYARQPGERDIEANYFPWWYRDKANDTTTPESTVWVCDCLYCGKAYLIDESPAECPEDYCSVGCENQGEIYNRYYRRDTYLDQIHADVQAALLAEAKRRK